MAVKASLILPAVAAAAEEVSSSFPYIYAPTGAGRNSAWALNNSATYRIQWNFLLPNNFNGSPVLRFAWSGNSTSTTSGDIRIGVEVATFTSGDGVDVASGITFDTANLATLTKTGGISGKSLEVSEITLSNFDSGVANDFCLLAFERIGGDAADTWTQTMYLWSAELEYNL